MSAGKVSTPTLPSPCEGEGLEGAVLPTTADVSTLPNATDAAGRPAFAGAAVLPTAADATRGVNCC